MAHLPRRPISALLLLCVLLAGCRQLPREYNCQFTAMDTFMHLTGYGGNGADSLQLARETILLLEAALDVNSEKSQLYAINHRQTDTVALSRDLAELLTLCLDLARETDGSFDPTVFPVVRQWGFTTGFYRVPAPEDLEALLPVVGHDNITLDGQTLTLKPGAQLDFGGIAKGWAGDRAAQVVRDDGVVSCLLRLGGNIHAIGTKPDGTPWKIGIQDPDSQYTLATLSVSDLAVVTSGSYQRYFIQDNQLYHHIIDPDTGRPADSALTSVTIVGPSGARCDALSTALFVMGLERAAQFWREHRDFEAVFVHKDGSIAITSGLEGNFTLTQAFQSRSVEVLK